MRVIASISICQCPEASSPPLLCSLPVLTAPAAQAQSLGYEGPTGVFVTPLASVSASPAKGLGQPSVAYHFLAGGPVIGDFSTVSITEGFASALKWVTPARFTPVRPDALWNNDFDILTARPSFCRRTPLNQVDSGDLRGRIFRFNDHDAYDGPPRHNRVHRAKPKERRCLSGGTKTITQISKKVPVLRRPVCAHRCLAVGLAATLRLLGARLRRAGPGLHRPRQERHHRGSEVSQQPQRIKWGRLRPSTFPLRGLCRAHRSFAQVQAHFDGGILHAGGNVGGLNLDARARVAFGISYGF